MKNSAKFYPHWSQVGEVGLVKELHHEEYGGCVVLQDNSVKCWGDEGYRENLEINQVKQMHTNREEVCYVKFECRSASQKGNPIVEGNPQDLKVKQAWAAIY